MGKYRYFKIFLIPLFLAVICFSLSSCMIFFMGDFTEYLINENFNDGTANNWTPEPGDNWFVSADEYRMSYAVMSMDYTNSYYNERVLDNSDHFSYQATVTQYSGAIADNQCGLIFRSEEPWIVDSDPIVAFNGYFLYIAINDVGVSDWALEKYESGLPTPLISGSDNPNINNTFGAKNVIRIKCEGSYIEVYFNGNFINSVEDGMYSNGYVGLFAQNDSAQMNSFGFDDVKLWIPREYQD